MHRYKDMMLGFEEAQTRRSSSLVNLLGKRLVDRKFPVERKFFQIRRKTYK
jgi:hypothetical protein